MGEKGNVVAVAAAAVPETLMSQAAGAATGLLGETVEAVKTHALDAAAAAVVAGTVEAGRGEDEEEAVENTTVDSGTDEDGEKTVS